MQEDLKEKNDEKNLTMMSRSIIIQMNHKVYHII